MFIVARDWLFIGFPNGGSFGFQTFANICQPNMLQPKAYISGYVYETFMVARVIIFFV